MMSGALTLALARGIQTPSVCSSFTVNTAFSDGLRGFLAVLMAVMTEMFIVVGETAGKYVRDRLKLVAK